MSRVALFVPPAPSAGAAQTLDSNELERAGVAWREALARVCTVVDAAEHSSGGAAVVNAGAFCDCVIALGRADCSVEETLNAARCASATDVPAPTVYVWPIGREEALHGAFMSGSLRLTRTPVHEVWMYQQSVPAARLVHHTLAESTMRVVPQLWTPTPLAAMLGVAAPADATYDAPSRETEGGADVVIVSDLAASTADVLTPLLMCAMVGSAVRSVIVLRDSPLPAGADAYIRDNVPELAGKVKHVTARRDEVVSFFMRRQHYSVFLYHQRGRTEFPSLLWDLCYVGVPVVHNLQTSMGAGLRYTDVSTATKLLTLLPASLGAPYLERNREQLRALMPERAAAMLRALLATTRTRVETPRDEAKAPNSSGSADGSS